jgi:hypothetical protein
MYGKRELTIENVRNRVNSYDLFSYYCSPFKAINTRFCSELRIDEYPTCCVYAYSNKLFYKDFATGDSYDDIGYIRTKYNVDFFTALSYINRDFNLDLSAKTLKGVPTMQFFGVPDKSINLKKYVKETSVIKVQVRQWEKEDKSFWNDKYNFTSKQLSFYRVYPIKFFWINNIMYSCKKNSYGYYLGNRKGIARWKIYQPLQPRESKWFSNINREDVQGVTQLPETGDTLYITSSLKDIIVLRKLGLDAIAPSAETTIIPEDIIAELKTRFKNLVIFYDNDNPGIIASNKHSKIYEADEICIPFKYISEGIKDPSDFVEKHSYEELLNVINTQKNERQKT